MVELKSKTHFSFLRGASHPHELIEEAARLGYEALGICDVNGVYGIPRAYWAAKDLASLKLLVGAEVSLSDGPPVSFLARDRKAYGQLCKLLTAAHHGKPKGEAKLSLKELCDFSLSGLIALPDPGSDFLTLNEAFETYVPLSRFLDGHDKKRTEEALAVGLPIVATNDVHYHVKNRRRLQDALTSVREGLPLYEAGFHLFSNSERYLKPPDQMRALFKDRPEAIERAIEVARSCHFCPSELRYYYPSEWIPEGHTAQSYLEEIVWQGAQQTYKGQAVPEKTTKLLRHELKLIGQLKYADYFLTIYDIVAFARSKGILCQGRGSAANSAVCFVLGITSLDPSEMELLFERFISAERDEPPDIDVDFEHERREEVIQYIYNKYGRHRAAMVSAVVTYRKRSSFRELSKAFGVDVGTLSAKKVLKDFETLAKSSPIEDCAEQIEELAGEMKGFPRHLSIHSGGFTLSAEPITEIVPVEPARMEGRTIIQWDKFDLDYLGLLKIDVLSLGMLSALRKCLALVDMELHEIPADDEPTYEMIRAGDTVGTFQIESRAQIVMCGRMQARNFYDLVIQIAMIRPGPIQGGMVHPFLKRRRGLEKVTYPHPKLEKILERTMGVPLFQEQVMQMAIDLGGFTPGESDMLRRAIGFSRTTDDVDMMGRKLMEGLLKNGLPKDFAESVFRQIQGFSSYGFPESHSASFARLAYASCYLKCHYPGEFLCSMINSQPLGFYSNHTLIDEAKRHGVEVIPIDPNHSPWDCEMVGRKVRLGLKVIKGLSKAEAEDLILGRPYFSLGHFLSKVKLRKEVLYAMAMGGAFEKFGLDQRHSLWQILDHQVREENEQLDLFSNLPLERETERFLELDEFSAIREDYEAFNLSTRGHPMRALRKTMNLPRTTSKKVKRMANNTLMSCAGLTIVKQRPATAKGVRFFTLEDEFGMIDLIFHKKMYEKYAEILEWNSFLIVKGVAQRDLRSVSVLVHSVRPLFNGMEVQPSREYR